MLEILDEWNVEIHVKDGTSQNLSFDFKAKQTWYKKPCHRKFNVKNNTALKKIYAAVISTRYVMSAGIERRTKCLSMSDTSKYTQYTYMNKRLCTNDGEDEMLIEKNNFKFALILFKNR